MPTTRLLCHFNGADGATSVSDEVAGVSWSFSGIELDTARQKFGSASLLCPNSGGDAATASGISGISPSGNYTMEFFGNLDDNGSYTGAYLGDPSGNYDNVHVSYSDNFGTKNIRWEVRDSGGSYIFQSDVNPGGSLDTFYHIAFVRDGTNYFLFFNGNRIGSVSSSTNTGTLSQLILGGDGGFASAWIDEARITDGVEYSGTTYTVPSSEFSVPVAPVAAFSANVTSGFAPQSITFTDASTNTPTSWLWERKTTGAYSTFSTSQNPVVSWDEGIYDVKLTATNAAGSDAEEKLDYISIAAVFAPAADTVTTSETAALTTEILLAAADTVTTSDSADLLTGSEFILAADTVTAADSASLTTAILLEASDTVTTADSATLTVPATVVLVPPSGGAHAQDDLNVGGVNKPAIPPTTDLPLALIRVLDPMKQNIEIITGRRGGRIETLADGATLEEAVTKINQIVARLMQ